MKKKYRYYILGFEKTAESQHVDEITNKIATFQFDTDTETSAILTDTGILLKH